MVRTDVVFFNTLTAFLTLTVVALLTSDVALLAGVGIRVEVGGLLCDAEFVDRSWVLVVGEGEVGREIGTVMGEA